MTLISPRTMWWATEAMVEKLGPEHLRSLDVRAGEHLAALLTTAFLHTPPTRVDAAGDVDLWFDFAKLPDSDKSQSILPSHTTSAAFEVKSMPGRYRHFERKIDEDSARGIDPTGRSLDVQVQTAQDVLREAGPSLLKARNQLIGKTSAATSRNAFLVMHMFDHMITEAMSAVMAPLLDPLTGVEDLDTVWVLWPLEHLTVWSSERSEWTELLFSGVLSNSITVPPPELDDLEAELGDLSVLQAAEQYFLTRIGYTGGSPYLYGFSAT